jgi:sterol desaturase/sphingolipid hydroxylase (fatty acid hydroxylase superfamily)
MIGIPVAFVTAGAFEWWAHKHILHGKGRKKESFWAFHFHEHHSTARRNDMIDADYLRSPFRWNAQGKEVLALAALAVPIAAVFPVAPFWSATSLWHLGHYYRVHKRSHLDPDWGREHLPWHYDHHMGPDQDKNWGVTRPWMDKLMGTRVVYKGTPKEDADRARRAKVRAEREAKAAANSAPAARDAPPAAGGRTQAG